MSEESVDFFAKLSSSASPPNADFSAVAAKPSPRRKLCAALKRERESGIRKGGGRLTKNSSGWLSSIGEKGRVDIKGKIVDEDGIRLSVEDECAAKTQLEVEIFGFYF